jgi:TRAP-type mannitol/chloroaromatic compound transport system substrate-binding protein
VCHEEEFAMKKTTPKSAVAAAPKQKSTSRRRFLAAGAASAAGVASLGFPMIARAAPVQLKFQSTWPAADIFHEFALDFARKVQEMSSGNLKIDVLPSGAVAKPLELLDAVNKNTLDGAHGVIAYHYGKQNALALWGSGPAFGMDANMVLAWHYYGGGKELLADIYKTLNMDVVSFLYGPMPTQPFGWFKKPVSKVSEMNGVKFRTVGLATDMYKDMGAAVNPLGGADIVPNLERGVIDAAEFNNASSDRILGFPKVAKYCMLQSYHQSSEQFEVLFNKKKYDALPAELKAVIKYAIEASSADMSWKAVHRYSQDHKEMAEKQGVKFLKTPDEILKKQLESWDQIAAKKSAENPTFKKVYESMRAFAQRAGAWHNQTSADFKMAYNHFFAKKG